MANPNVALVERVVREQGGAHDLAPMTRVRAALSAAGLSRADQDAAIDAARREGKVTGSANEGRHGITAAEREAEVRGRDGDPGLGFLSLRKDAPEGIRKTLNKGQPTGTHDDEKRVITWVMTTGATDRDGETVDPTGIDVSDFRKNRVVAWNHDTDDFPIGRLEDDPWNDWIGEGTKYATAANGESLGPKRMALLGDVFFSRENPKGDLAYRMAKEGTLGGGSISFLPMGPAQKNEDGGAHYPKSKLLEFTICPVPSNPDAVALAKSLKAAPEDKAPLPGHAAPKPLDPNALKYRAGQRVYARRLLQVPEYPGSVKYHVFARPADSLKVLFDADAWKGQSLVLQNRDGEIREIPAGDVRKSVEGATMKRRKLWTNANKGWVLKSDGPLSPEAQAELDGRGIDDVQVADDVPPDQEWVEEELQEPEHQEPPAKSRRKLWSNGSKAWLLKSDGPLDDAGRDELTERGFDDVRVEEAEPDGDEWQEAEEKVPGNLIAAETMSRTLKPTGGGVYSGENIATYKQDGKFFWAEWRGSSLAKEHGSFATRDAAWADAQKWVQDQFDKLMGGKSKSLDEGPPGKRALKRMIKAIEDETRDVEKAEVNDAAEASLKLLRRALKRAYGDDGEADLSEPEKKLKAALDDCVGAKVAKLMSEDGFSREAAAGIAYQDCGEKSKATRKVLKRLRPHVFKAVGVEEPEPEEKGYAARLWQDIVGGSGWSVVELYTGRHLAGPFGSEKEARQWARTNNYDISKSAAAESPPEPTETAKSKRLSKADRDLVKQALDYMTDAADKAPPYLAAGMRHHSASLKALVDEPEPKAEELAPADAERMELALKRLDAGFGKLAKTYHGATGRKL